MSIELSNIYNKLSNQGRKRVDSYAKFILDEEIYSQDVKVMSELIHQLKQTTIWRRIELGVLDKNEMENLVGLLQGKILDIEHDQTNPYRVTLEELLHKCQSFLLGDEMVLDNIIESLKSIENSVEQ